MKIMTAAVAGALIGAALAQYYPDPFVGGLEALKVAISKPFDGVRNDLALRFGLIGAGAGLVVGFIWQQSGKKG